MIEFFNSNRVSRKPLTGTVTINGTTTQILSNATYEPFGAVNGWTWGNGATVIRSYNTDGNLSVISSAGLHISLGYDNALRPTSITDLDSSALSRSYGYDILDRLIAANDATVTEGWTYDANGNRLTQTVGAQPPYLGLQQATFTYNQTNNQFQAGSNPGILEYDAAGNGFGYEGFDGYDAEGNLLNGQAFLTNGLRQRVANTLVNAVIESRRVFDDEGHILGEYESDPADWSALDPIQETVYLGDLPVAVLMGQETFDSNGDPTGIFTQTLYYVHADHLGTPRRLTLPSNNTVIWRWDSDAFGNGFPYGHPPGSSLYVSYNLRFPGQIYEPTIGTYYNWYRDYDPGSGRYLQSDPIGLAGGSFSTYAYVNGNPLWYSDPLGQGPLGTAIGAGIGGFLGGLGGGVVGGALGAGGGTLVAPGVGTVGGGISGAEVGAGIGATGGAVVGGYIGNQVGDALDNIMQMAKGGSQNKENEYSRAARMQPDPCAWLREQYKAAADSATRQKIITAQKALGCRRNSSTRDDCK